MTIEGARLGPGTRPVALITGANTGIGRVMARELARAGNGRYLEAGVGEADTQALSSHRP